jgi:hypothetical protein
MSTTTLPSEDRAMQKIILTDPHSIKIAMAYADKRGVTASKAVAQLILQYATIDQLTSASERSQPRSSRTQADAK